MAQEGLLQAGRLDEMSHQKLSLRIELHEDGDIGVFIEEDGAPLHDEAGRMRHVEFCSCASGGGRSPHTMRALRQLYQAMLLDAQEKPDGIPKYPFWLKSEMEKQFPEK